MSTVNVQLKLPKILRYACAAPRTEEIYQATTKKHLYETLSEWHRKRELILFAEEPYDPNTQAHTSQMLNNFQRLYVIRICTIVMAEILSGDPI